MADGPSTTGDAAERLESLFERAAELAPALRAAFLDECCAGEPALRAELDSLLRYADIPDTRLVQTATIAPGPERPVPERIGEYRIARIIGEGGMGVVYEAVQDQPRRTVALKVLRSPLASPALVRRFEHEAEVLGQLHHPGIAQIFQAGSIDTPFGPQPFFAMELIRGLSLTEHARALDTRRRLDLLARICDAFQHAHQKGVIHRDPKPANIMIAEDGQPKVLDFGVARVTQAGGQTRQTEAGMLVGTLPYMSPEQVCGDPAAIDTRSDVYSLGVILYELLAGALPYDVGTSVADAARIIREQEARPLTAIDPALRGDITTIVGKALQKDKDRRYASAAELAADLRRCLSDEPISARPPTAMYQLRKFARRNRVLVAGTAATATAVLLGGIAAAVLAVQAFRSEREAVAQSHRAALAAAAGELEMGSAGPARRRLEQVPPAERGWEWRYLHGRSDQSLATLALPGLHTTAVPVRLDGRELVAAGGGDGDLRIWDPASGTIVRTIPNPGVAISTLVSNPEGSVLIAISPGAVIAWEVASSRQAWRQDAPLDLGDSPFSPDGRMLVVAPRGQFRLRILDAATGSEVRELPTQEPESLGAWFSADGQQILYCSGAGTLAIDARSGAPLKSLPLGWAIEGGRFLIGVSYPDLVFLDAGSGNEAMRLRGRSIDPHATIGDTLAVGAPDGSIEFWDLQHAQRRGILRGHQGRLNSLRVSISGSRLISASDGEVKVWDAAAQPDPRIVRPWTEVPGSVALARDGSRAATFGWGSVRLWDVGTGREEWCRVDWRESAPPVADFSPDAALLTFAGWDGRITTVETQTGRTIRAIPQGPTPAAALAYVGQSTQMVVADATGGLALYGADGARQSESPPLTGAVFRIAADALHPRFATGGATVAVWSLSPLMPLRTIPSRGANVTALAFDPPGRLLAAAMGDRSILLVDPDRGRIVTRGRAAADPIALAFSPDSSRLLVSCADGTLRIHDAASLQELLVLSLRGGTALRAVFTPDGGSIIASGQCPIWAFETAPNPDRTPLQARWAAARELCEPLFRDSVVEDVLAAIQARTALDPQLRADALAAARAHGDQFNSLNSAAWGVVRFRGKTNAEYLQALRWAGACCRGRPGIGSMINTLGVAQFRVGRFEEALASLNESDRLSRQARGPDPYDTAFLAMVHQRLGHTDEAHRLLDLSRSLVPADAAPSDIGTIVQEAIGVCGGAGR